MLKTTSRGMVTVLVNVGPSDVALQRAHNPRDDHLARDHRAGEIGRAPHVTACRVHPGLLRAAVIHQQINVVDRHLRVAGPVDEQHRRRRLLQKSARHERHPRREREELLARRHVGIDCRARLEQVEQVLRCVQAVLLPRALEVAVNGAAVHHRSAQALLLRVRQHRRPVPAPAAALHHDAPGIEVTAGCHVIENGREHALRADVGLDRRLTGAGHVESEYADAMP